MAEPIQPQWDAPGFEVIRNSIMARFNCSQEDAVIRLQLQNLWNDDGAQRTPAPPTPPRRISPPLEPEEIIPLPVKKKMVYPDFDINASIPDTLPFFPSQFAIDKIKHMEYVELWYFTAEGIQDASKVTPTTSDDTMAATLDDDGEVTFRQAKAVKASSNVIVDEALSWEQISTARHNILQTAAVWPEKHRIMLAKFFMNLEALKATGARSRGLILYQATARRRWHASLKGLEPPFNLATIKMNNLRELNDQIRDQDQKDLNRQASNLPPALSFPNSS